MRNDSVLNYKMFTEMCHYAKVHLSAGTQFDLDSRRVLSVACMKCLLVWLKNDCSLIIKNAQVSKSLRELIRHAIKIKANRGGSVHPPHHTQSADGGTYHSYSPTDFDFKGTDPPPLWDTMSYQAQGNEDHSNALKDVYRATDQLSRFFTNDIGAYYQFRGAYRRCSPMHRYAEAYLAEHEIEEHIWKSVHGNNLSDKWQRRDRIRYFAYKKNRIFTLIEMPRLNQLERDKKTAAAPSKESEKKVDEKGMAAKPSRQRVQLQHLEPRHCDVIVLIRDAYGKYA